MPTTLDDGSRLDTDVLPRGRGRNHTGVLRTATGTPVFVKRLDGEPAEVSRRFARAVAFERLIGATRVVRPRCLGGDERSATLVFENLCGAVPFDPPAGDAGQAGRVVADLHAVDTAGPGWNRVERTPPQRPELDLLDALTPTAYLTASGAQLELWALLQSDGPVVDALRRLRHAETAAPRRPVHGDLRPDQFLWFRDRLHLTDWEEFRIADPARDVGNMAGSWLYLAVLDGGGAGAFDRARQLIAAFWQGYAASRPVDADGGFAARAAAYAGWHQYDMSTAVAGRHSRLTGTAFTAVALGRQLLLAPARLASTIGLGPGRPAWN
jgi:aminoglycoside phosphotransferase (APT) family kinase protein